LLDRAIARQVSQSRRLVEEVGRWHPPDALHSFHMLENSHIRCIDADLNPT
jgi:hypothetical protein